MLYADDIFLLFSAIFSGLPVDQAFLKADGLHIYIFCLIGCVSKKCTRVGSAASYEICISIANLM